MVGDAAEAGVGVVVVIGEGSGVFLGGGEDNSFAATHLLADDDRVPLLVAAGNVGSGGPFVEGIVWVIDGPVLLEGAEGFFFGGKTLA